MKVPFVILPTKLLRRISLFRPISSKLSRVFSKLDLLLKQSRSDLDKEEYITVVLTNTIMIFIFLVVIFNVLQIYFQIQAIGISIFAAGLASLFVFFNSINYPKIIVNKRIRGIERNLLPSLQDFLAQANAGVPIFNIIVNISNSDYNEVSKEFEKAVREINAGKSQVEALSDLGAANPSVFFRRTLWQISNGLTSGADMVKVIKESINSISDEQLIQIQEYGARLSPLSMFYMLIAVIMPILAITFILILSSLISTNPTTMKIILWGFYAGIVFMQIMFLGIIKSKRPNLI